MFLACFAFARCVRFGLDGGHAPAGIALMAGEASGLLDGWASSPNTATRGVESGCLPLSYHRKVTGKRAPIPRM
jgi:hypothetical protein